VGLLVSFITFFKVGFKKKRVVFFGSFFNNNPDYNTHATCSVLHFISHCGLLITEHITHRSFGISLSLQLALI